MLSQVSPSPSPGSPELPVLRRSLRAGQSHSRSRSRSQSRSQSQGQLTLPKTNSYVFTHGLFRRTILSSNPPSVQYSCTQPSCEYTKKMITTRVVSTSNLIKHYNHHHGDIPTSVAEERQLKEPEREKADFFKKTNAGTGDQIRKLIL
jgi:hypothetical protein